ncbi:MAG: ring-1,2-phenylacetyl-CoA epoxidase subunit PaaE [Saprospiraceae bacterium]|jgi:ring-1,2-phenylacetyl-CoA epoxidase subunit PaaE
MFHSLKVSKLVKETESAVSILFELNESQKETFRFKAGQFLTLKHDIDGQEVRRSYSLCSSPKSGELKVAIKKIEGGLFSSFAVDVLKEGQELEVGIPAGKFTIDCESKNERKYVFVTAGSGITPSISMIKTILAEEPLSIVHLLYGNKTEAETIFFNEIENLKQSYGSRLNVKYFLSKENGANELTTGRISSDKISQVKSEWGGINAVHGFYICGPGDLIDEIKETLEKDGVSKDKIHFELFTSKTNSAKESIADESFEVSRVTVSIDEVDYTFEVKAGKEILAAGLAAGIDIPYSCQGGVCGSCECTVTKGKVELNQNMILSEEEVEEGQTLACQAVPKTAVVALSFEY